MKFTTAWAEIASQNVTLKVSAGFLTLCCLGLSITAMKLALKEPVVIERACYSNSLKNADTKHTDSEVNAFVRVALGQRFDSDNKDSSYLSDKERAFKEQEQKALSEKEMKQKIVINEVKLEKASIQVDADRILAIGNVRSALTFPLIISLTSTVRSESNPYGLILGRVEQPKENPNAKKE